MPKHDLLPFGSVKQCPKCGAQAPFSIRYCSGRPWPLVENPAHEPHLIVECGRCHWCGHTKCADAKKEKP